jgi:hypothetical protein
MLAASRERGLLCSEQAVLRISGNPAKFLQGHNVAGPSVAHEVAIVQGAVRAFPKALRPVGVDDDRLPALHRSRIDVTRHVDLGTHQAVHDFIQLAASTTRSRKGPALLDGTTVYWQKESRKWSLKVYCKFCELERHPCSDPVLQPLVREWCQSHLRCELTLRGPELKVRGVLNESILWEYFRKLEMATVNKKSSVIGFDLPMSVLACLLLWKDGHDVTTMYKRATFYKYRRQILTVVGVDISLKYAQQLEPETGALLGVDELESRQVLEVPEFLDKTLFKVG